MPARPDRPTGFVDKLMFWRKPTPPGIVVDPAEGGAAPARERGTRPEPGNRRHADHPAQEAGSSGRHLLARSVTVTGRHAWGSAQSARAWPRHPCLAMLRTTKSGIAEPTPDQARERSACDAPPLSDPGRRRAGVRRRRRLRPDMPMRAVDPDQGLSAREFPGDPHQVLPLRRDHRNARAARRRDPVARRPSASRRNKRRW